LQKKIQLQQNRPDKNRHFLWEKTGKLGRDGKRIAFIYIKVHFYFFFIQKKKKKKKKKKKIKKKKKKKKKKKNINLFCQAPLKDALSEGGGYGGFTPHKTRR